MIFDEKLFGELTKLNIFQLVVVNISPDIPVASVNLFSYNEGKWTSPLIDLPAVVGKNGATGNKQEGDNKTPLGLYKISLIFGTLSDSEINKMPFRRISSEDKYIDDSEHPDYNCWISGGTSARSYETMLRPDGLYALGAIIDYNTNPIIPGKGSAIFLHIWRGQRIGTEGCIAMSLTNLKLLLESLKFSRNPHILITS